MTYMEQEVVIINNGSSRRDAEEGCIVNCMDEIVKNFSVTMQRIMWERKVRDAGS